jgi:hypothetical protein
MQTVKNLNTLKAMERLGHIKLHPQTGSKITGLYSSKKFTCYYVDDGASSFDYKGKKYGVKSFYNYHSIFDGGFAPYVIKLQNS